MSAVRVNPDIKTRGGPSRARLVQPTRLFFTVSRIGACAVPLFLCLFCMGQAQDNSMKIMRNHTLVVTSYELVDPINDASVTPMYMVVLQKAPFIEIYLQNPVYQTQLSRRQRFRCREVGVFKDARSRQTWTIGKGCRPL